MIPKKLKIGGVTYKVQIVKEFDDSRMAQTDFVNHTIKILSGPLRFQEQTLWHEIMHCINSQLTEAECDWLGNSIFQILSDNCGKIVFGAANAPTRRGRS